MFDTLERQRASDQAAAAIRDRILSGDIAPGERLPSERDLAGQLGVNRTTVREALRALEQLGLIAIRHGGGAIVQDHTRVGLQVLPYLLTLGGRIDPELLAHLLEVRRDVGIAIAGRAAERRDPDGLARLEAALAASEDALADGAPPPDAVGAVDLAFFVALTHAAGNRVYTYILHALRRLYERAPALFAGLFTDPAGTLGCHRELAAAVRAGDAARATAVVRRYLDHGTPPRGAERRT